ncbi:NAD-dependent epimerase/dehydratase family protein [Paenibacillus zanthoxyli]|uniref:NAD-dependent epimerase/dehydratase family protein n=1 Tax=Paenibacillus zanthoxyli TaxID=369399 RepID=UPI00046FCEA3|nr:NAD(P)-dependent oxidoreductase [Paenibacillus zanthoxyli]
MFTQNRKNIAILGATGHIAKNLIIGLSSSQDYRLYLFARSKEKLDSFLVSNNIVDNFTICEYQQFEQASRYNVIINCIGIGNPQDLVSNPFSVFQITEHYDNMVLDYLQKIPETIYINLSSGATYGSEFQTPAAKDKSLTLDINNLSNKDYYGIAKLNMEGKHRSLQKLKIIDLRVFGYFSSYIDLDSKFLITDIIHCIKSGTTLYTSPENIMRDYVHPLDFLQLIKLCMVDNIQNDVFDVYSLKPISKFEMLEFFAEEYDLKYEIKSDKNYASITGSKSSYYTMNYKATSIGYQPHFSSLQSIVQGYQQFRMRNKYENN